MLRLPGLTSSLEDYLEVIYHLTQGASGARATQVADAMKVKKSSVTSALRALAQKRLIHYSPYSEVTLTPLGMQAAADIIRRHEALKDFLTGVLGVPAIQAEDSACRLEHALSPEVTEPLICFMEFLEICPRAGKAWIEKYRSLCGKTVAARDCAACLDQSRASLTKAVAQEAVHETLFPLSAIQPGQKAQIVKIAHQGAFRRRILEMGVTAGAVLTVERVAPLGDPVDIKIRGYHLSLRKKETDLILVKRILEPFQLNPAIETRDPDPLRKG